MYPNRTICDVFSAMRDCHKTHNYSYLLGLIEEAQNMANRMEAKLFDIHDWESLKKEIKVLEKKKQQLKGENDEQDW